jgi:hypothetical protein
VRNSFPGKKISKKFFPILFPLRLIVHLCNKIRVFIFKIKDRKNTNPISWADLDLQKKNIYNNINKKKIVEIASKFHEIILK